MLSIQALLHGPNLHYLDHLAPLCSLLDISLTVTDKDILKISKKFYPNLSVNYMSYREVPYALANHSDVIITCFPTDMFNEIFFLPRFMDKLPFLNVWCPHGNSLKGFDDYYLDVLQKEKILFCYGELALSQFENMKDKAAPKIIKIGNYRLHYYNKYKLYYSQIVKNMMPDAFYTDYQTLLYAPTWKETDSLASILKPIHSLDRIFDGKLRVIIQLHPNTYKKFGDRLLNELNQLKHSFVLRQNPIILPILDFVDFYLGDFSSVGYDFLAFDKPAFTLTKGSLLGEYIPIEKLSQLPDRLQQPICPKIQSKRSIIYQKAYFDSIQIKDVKLALHQYCQNELPL